MSFAERNFNMRLAGARIRNIAQENVLKVRPKRRNLSNMNTFQYVQRHGVKIKQPVRARSYVKHVIGD